VRLALPWAISELSLRNYCDDAALRQAVTSASSALKLRQF